MELELFNSVDVTNGKPKKTRKPRALSGIASMPIRCESEWSVQRLIVQWLSLRGITAVHIPNFNGGGTTGQRRGSQLKQIGQVAGMPDLLIVQSAPRLRDARAVFVEVKKANGYLRPEQREIHNMLRSNNYHVLTVYGVEDAIRQLTELGY